MEIFLEEVTRENNREAGVLTKKYLHHVHSKLCKKYNLNPQISQKIRKKHSKKSLSGEISAKEYQLKVAKELGVKDIKSFTKYDGDIIYDKSKPDGQLSKLLWVYTMRSELKWFPKLDFVETYKSLISEYEQYLEDNK